jgi:hypothetical protein
MAKYGVYGTSWAVAGQLPIVVYSFGPHHAHKLMGLEVAVLIKLSSGLI